MNILEQQRRLYQINFYKEGVCPKGLFWRNKETQLLRFEILLKEFELSKKISIHDVGVGFADLHEYMLENKISHIYSGTEIVKDMITYACKKFTDIKLFNRNILSAPDNEKYDYIVLSGTFNLRTEINETQYKKYVFSVLKKMFFMANNAISFNFLTPTKTQNNNSLHYFEPKIMFDFCLKNLSKFVILNQAYSLQEATITVFKNII